MKLAQVIEEMKSWAEDEYATPAGRRIAKWVVAIEASPSSPIPEGMVLVPREPTEAMLDAGHGAGDFHIMHYDGTDKPGTPRYSLRKSWDAMLAASEEKA